MFTITQGHHTDDTLDTGVKGAEVIFTLVTWEHQLYVKHSCSPKDISTTRKNMISLSPMNSKVSGQMATITCAVFISQTFSTAPLSQWICNKFLDQRKGCLKGLSIKYIQYHLHNIIYIDSKCVLIPLSP